MNAAAVLDAASKTIKQLAAHQTVEVPGQIGHDITCIVPSKVAYARNAAKSSANVYLISGHEASALEKAISCKVIGTHVLA